MFYLNALIPFDSVCFLQDCRTLKERGIDIMSVLNLTSRRVRMNYSQTWYVFAVPRNEIWWIICIEVIVVHFWWILVYKIAAHDNFEQLCLEITVHCVKRYCNSEKCKSQALWDVMLCGYVYGYWCSLVLRWLPKGNQLESRRFRITWKSECVGYWWNKEKWFLLNSGNHPLVQQHIPEDLNSLPHIRFGPSNVSLFITDINFSLSAAGCCQGPQL
jgi:hypothetical protein